MNVRFVAIESMNVIVEKEMRKFYVSNCGGIGGKMICVVTTQVLLGGNCRCSKCKW